MFMHFAVSTFLLHIKELIIQIDRNHPVAKSRFSAFCFVYVDVSKRQISYSKIQKKLYIKLIAFLSHIYSIAIIERSLR